MTEDELREAFAAKTFDIGGKKYILVDVAISIIAPVLAAKDALIERQMHSIATLIRERDEVRDIMQSYRPSPFASKD